MSVPDNLLINRNSLRAASYCAFKTFLLIYCIFMGPIWGFRKDIDQLKNPLDSGDARRRMVVVRMSDQQDPRGS